MKGFTLIEVMITVAIVSILAAIAYPSYVEHVFRSRRADAKATLLELAQTMERNYLVSTTYKAKDGQGNNIDNDYVFDDTFLKNRKIVDYYRFVLSGVDANGTTYTLGATRKDAKANDGCGVLTLASNGERCAYADTGDKLAAPCAATKDLLEKCWSR